MHRMCKYLSHGTVQQSVHTKRHCQWFSILVVLPSWRRRAVQPNDRRYVYNSYEMVLYQLIFFDNFGLYIFSQKVKNKSYIRFKWGLIMNLNYSILATYFRLSFHKCATLASFLVFLVQYVPNDRIKKYLFLNRNA